MRSVFRPVEVSHAIEASVRSTSALVTMAVELLFCENVPAILERAANVSMLVCKEKHGSCNAAQAGEIGPRR